MTKNAVANLKNRQVGIAEEFKKILLKVAGMEIENRVQSVSIKLAMLAVELFEEKAESSIALGKPVEISSSGETTISRQWLLDNESGEVVLCPTRIEGVKFLKKYNAWGYVNLSKNHKPKFLAMYVGKPQSSVLYFGEIESITQPLKSKEELENISQEDRETFEMGKRVIFLKAGSLHKLAEPIPLRDMKIAPRRLRYTTIEKLAKASFVEDL
jgi:hypothetical protein